VSQSSTIVVTFDVGQTLVDLDLDFLATRLAGRGVHVDVERLTRSAPEAWRTYDTLVEEGAAHPWKQFMHALLTGAGVAEPAPHVDWLYEQQAKHNLWRKPIAPMIDLVRELRAKSVKIAALSNSEGHLADLLAEIELAPLFHAIIDSTRVGVSKPEPRIFEITLEHLGVVPGAGRGSGPTLVVHVGDSWAADVEGALAAGWKAIWYRSRAGTPQNVDPTVPVATNADETRRALSALGV
jgi:FMN hydrolase / 5-amino-6-(5-phospho-D-ribitylamino)uracil phosphatase